MTEPSLLPRFELDQARGNFDLVLALDLATIRRR